MHVHCTIDRRARRVERRILVVDKFGCSHTVTMNMYRFHVYFSPAQCWLQLLRMAPSLHVCASGYAERYMNHKSGKTFWYVTLRCIEPECVRTILCHWIVGVWAHFCVSLCAIIFAYDRCGDESSSFYAIRWTGCMRGTRYDIIKPTMATKDN